MITNLSTIEHLKMRAILITGVSCTLLLMLIVGLIGRTSTRDSLVTADGAPDLYFEINEPMASFRGGNAALDYVLENADTATSVNLLVGANTAYQAGRLQDAAFLFYAGRIRARYDLQKYEPTATGGDSPAVALDFLIVNASEPIIRNIFFHPTDYAKMVKRLEAWAIEEPADYEPGWAYTLREVPDNLAIKLTAETLEDARPVATLLGIPEYINALKAMREFNELPPERQEEKVAVERYTKAERTMQRIEREKDLKGIYCQMHRKTK